MMARQRPDASAAFLDSRSSPESSIRQETAHAGSQPSATRRFAGLVDRGLGTVVVLGLHAGRPGATFSALAGLDASAVVIVSHPGVMKRSSISQKRSERGQEVLATR